MPVGVGLGVALFAQEPDAARVVVGYRCHAGAQHTAGVPAEVVQPCPGPFCAVEVTPVVALLPG